MPVSRADVMSAVAMRRPAQATEQIVTTVNATQAKPVQYGTIGRVLSGLADNNEIVRLDRAEAARCGAHPQHFGPGTSYWITHENYATYVQAEIDAPETTGPAPVLPPEVSPSLMLLATFERLDSGDPMEILATVERETALDLLTIARRIKLRRNVVQHLRLDFNTAGGEAAAELIGTLHGFQDDLGAFYRHLTGTDLVLGIEDLGPEHTALAPIATLDDEDTEPEGKAPAGTATSFPASPTATATNPALLPVFSGQ